MSLNAIEMIFLHTCRHMWSDCHYMDSPLVTTLVQQPANHRVRIWIELRGFGAFKCMCFSQLRSNKHMFSCIYCTLTLLWWCTKYLNLYVQQTQMIWLVIGKTKATSANLIWCSYWQNAGRLRSLRTFIQLLGYWLQKQIISNVKCNDHRSAI